jgi:DNA-binding MarR family transcriptional regulator
MGQAVSIAFLLHRAGQEYARLYKTAARQYGDHVLTLPQLAVMQCLRNPKTRVTQRQIMQQTGMDRSTVSELVKRLGDRVLVYGTEANGRGGSELQPSEEGLRYLRRSEKCLSTVERKFLARLPHGTAHMLHTLLTKLAGVKDA